MSNFMLMEPTNQTFQELFSNGVKYIVPRFQRDYAWNQEQWEDLWADIETLEEEHYHYMGYIVLQRKEQYYFDVIDGQQRLVTSTLIILTAMKKIQDLIDDDKDAENNKERLKELGNVPTLLTHNFVSQKLINRPRVVSYPCHHCWRFWSEYPVFSSTECFVRPYKIVKRYANSKLGLQPPTGFCKGKSFPRQVGIPQPPVKV